MNYYRVTTPLDVLIVRCASESDLPQIRRNGQWVNTAPAMSVAYWRSLGYAVDSITEADANG